MTDTILWTIKHWQYIQIKHNIQIYIKYWHKSDYIDDGDDDDDGDNGQDIGHLLDLRQIYINLSLERAGHKMVYIV